MTGSQGKAGETLIVNVGSSSLKFRVYRGKKILEDKEIEVEGSEKKRFEDALRELYHSVKKYDIKKTGYRIVCGGQFHSPALVTDRLMRDIRAREDLNPLHTENAIKTAEFLRKNISGKHVFCFDSFFHRTMPEKAKGYAIPRRISERYGIKRYGFHGIAHESLVKDAERLTGKRYKNVVSCQLGGGVSLCAIKDGKSVDTTMGFTPLSGLMMETRSGDLDPSIMFYLKKKGFKDKEIEEILEKRSGLKGVSGLNNMKEIIKKKRDPEAKLAFDMLVYQVKKTIGAYVAAMGKADLIVLGGGMARAPEVREGVLEGLEGLGIKINKDKIGKKSPIKISSGPVDVIAIETDEQKHILELVEKI